MEPYLIITQLNDFVFCPKSIYFHSLYGRYDDRVYKQTPQIVGTMNHESIDQKKYSSAKRYIQSLPVYSEAYRLCGKIDILDQDTQTLIERKTQIKTIYDGYKYQMWAQYLCLTEMGYPVKRLQMRSLVDNKVYELPVPQATEQKILLEHIQSIRAFDPADKNFVANPNKCQNCIYAHLCDSNPLSNSC